jgi:type II secretory pathway pseudopilin PulG
MDVDHHLAKGKWTRGFALLDTLVAVALSALYMLALHSALVGVVHGNRYARNLTAATRLAQVKLEQQRKDDYGSLTTGADSSRLNADGTTTGAGAIYQRSWSVSAGPIPDTKQVVVTVTWSQATAHRVVLETIVAQ